MARLERQVVGWRTQAPGDRFGGLTLPEFEAVIKKVADVKREILDLETSLRGNRQLLLLAEKEAMKIAKRVTAGMRGDPNHGSDSALLRACGFVLDSERKSGLTRKRKAAKSVVPPSGATG